MFKFSKFKVEKKQIKIILKKLKQKSMLIVMERERKQKYKFYFK